MEITKKTLIPLAQFLLGAAMWFYVFGVVFTSSATIENLTIPLVAAAAGSAVMSAFWSIVSSIPAYLVALYYSLAFWGWAIFQSISGGDFMSTIFWCGVALGVYICGLVGSYSVRAIISRGRPSQCVHLPDHHNRS